MPVPVNPDLLIEPPRCQDKHPKSGRDPERGQCPKCTAWDRYKAAKLRDDYRTGRRRPGDGRTPLATTVKREHQCRAPGHRSRPVAGCQDCRAWRRYEAALRRRAEAAGTLERMVDAYVVRAHLQVLMDKDTGGWHAKEIAAVTGVSYGTIVTIASGRRTDKIFPTTWAAIRVLEPKGVRRGRRTNLVDATEARRIVQGLGAQGWTLIHMSRLMGHTSKHAAARIAGGDSEWISDALLRDVRALRDKLGPYDIGQLARPMPGMNSRAATYAARRGWVPLAAWTGKTIGDPNAQPYAPQPSSEPDEFEPDEIQPDDGVSGHTVAFIDPMLYPRVLGIAQRVEEVKNMRPDDDRVAFIDPIGRVTRLEAHAVTAVAVDAGMSSSEIATMLGYPTGNKKQLEVGERQVARMRNTLRSVQEWFESDQPDDFTEWFFTARRSAGRNHMRRLLPALFAVQGAPYGPGWTVEQLADRCGVSVESMEEFLAWASREGDRMWERPRTTAGGRSGMAVSGCADRVSAQAA